MVATKKSARRGEENWSLARLVSYLIRIPSVNSNNRSEDLENLRLAENFIRNWFNEHGVEAKTKDFNGYPVVLAEVGKGKRTIMLNRHMDVVPVGEENRWSFQPFSGELRGDKIYGRGAVDMKSGLAVFMALTLQLAKEIDYKILFASVSDEETGGSNCSKSIAETYKPDLVLVSEPTGEGNIAIGEKGVFNVKLITNGKPSHSSRPSLGENAIAYMVEELKGLSRIEEAKLNVPDEVRPVLDRSVELFGKDAKIVTFNPAIISGGIKANVVPNRCEAVVDMRVPPGITSAEVLMLANSFLHRAQLTMGPSSEANYTNPEDPYVLKFFDNVLKEIGSSRLTIFTGASDGRFFRYRGIPTIEYCSGNFELAHAYDEHITLGQLDSTYRVYRSFLTSI